MRREHGLAFAIRQRIGLTSEGVEPVGIEDEGDRALADE